MQGADVAAGLRAAVQLGAASADVVAVEARKHATHRPDDTGLSVTEQVSETVVSLTARRPHPAQNPAARSPGDVS